MYQTIIVEPTDQDLETYPSMYLTGLHEWDLSVFDYSQPPHDGEPICSTDQMKG